MNTVTATAGALPKSFKDVWLISAGHGLTHWYTATFYLLLPLIGNELGLSYTEIGLIMTIQHLAGALSNLPGGFVVDIVGKKGYLMAASLFWVGFPYALMSLTHDFWMLLVCVTIVGIGNNIWHPAAIPTLAYRYPERKGLVLSFHGMGGNLGEAFAPFVIGTLLTWLSWRAVVVINVIPGLVMSALILLLLGAFSMTKSKDGSAINDDGETRSLMEYMRSVGGLLKNKTLMLVSCSSGLRTVTQAGLLTFLPVFLLNELHYSNFATGLCVGTLPDRRLHRGPDRRPPVGQNGPQAGDHVEHAADRRDDHRHGAFRQNRAIRRVYRAGRFLPLRDALGAAGLGGRVGAEKHGGRRRGPAVRLLRDWLGHLPVDLRHARRPLRHLHGVLLSRRHHRLRQPAGIFSAQDRHETGRARRRLTVPGEIWLYRSNNEKRALQERHGHP